MEKSPWPTTTSEDGKSTQSFEQQPAGRLTPPRQPLLPVESRFDATGAIGQGEAPDGQALTQSYSGVPLPDAYKTPGDGDVPGDDAPKA